MTGAAVREGEGRGGERGIGGRRGERAGSALERECEGLVVDRVICREQV